MDVTYTQEELKKLSEKLSDVLLDESVEEAYNFLGVDTHLWELSNNVFLIMDHGITRLTPAEHIDATFPKDANLKKLFYGPLDLMPLLINDSEVLYRTIATWRLSIGK